MPSLEEVRQTVQAIRTTVPGAAVIVYHDNPITPRVRVFHDNERPRYHLSLPPDPRIVNREYRRLLDAGRTVVFIDNQREGDHPMTRDEFIRYERSVLRRFAQERNEAEQRPYVHPKINRHPLTSQSVHDSVSYACSCGFTTNNPGAMFDHTETCKE